MNLKGAILKTTEYKCQAVLVCYHLDRIRFSDTLHLYHVWLDVLSFIFLQKGDISKLKYSLSCCWCPTLGALRAALILAVTSVCRALKEVNLWFRFPCCFKCTIFSHLRATSYLWSSFLPLREVAQIDAGLRASKPAGFHAKPKCRVIYLLWASCSFIRKIFWYADWFLRSKEDMRKDRIIIHVL